MQIRRFRAAGLAVALAFAITSGAAGGPVDPTHPAPVSADDSPPAAPPASGAKILLNLDQRGVALQGYDPVAFFTDGKAVKGSPELLVRHRGATYLFASAAHRDLFQQEPARYEPAFGGYCAYGVSQGHLAPVQIDTWQIHDGRLLLNYDGGVRKRFDKDRSDNLAKADRNWPGIVAKEGKVPAR